MSGSGNVSTYAIEKLLDLGAIPVTASDSTGYGVSLVTGFSHSRSGLHWEVPSITGMHFTYALPLSRLQPVQSQTHQPGQ